MNGWNVRYWHSGYSETEFQTPQLGKAATHAYRGVRALMAFETHQGAHRHAELSDLLRAAELGQIDDEAGREHFGALLAQ